MDHAKKERKVFSVKRLFASLLAVALVFSLAFSLTACSSSKEETYEIAMITDIGTIDDKSFNQGTWEGIAAYADAHDITHKYYKPTEQSTDAYLAAIQLAVDGGAKIIVTPGFLFETPIFLAQDMYPEVKFMLIDGTPHNEDYSEFRTNSNASACFTRNSRPAIWWDMRP
jgi:basic membrane protein A